eukprot:TRINITY_DN18497_c1_g1_i1.p1 TRINITY_DN18497_c1_g1~~TRINITY_DN18497_c1_g1_i1.p1  ORF type:complete len:906 (-),score=216.29 TRINITY_DN18497_c1_g1_i1:76-2793(-)
MVASAAEDVSNEESLQLHIRQILLTLGQELTAADRVLLLAPEGCELLEDGIAADKTDGEAGLLHLAGAMRLEGRSGRSELLKASSRQLQQLLDASLGEAFLTGSTSAAAGELDLIVDVGIFNVLSARDGQTFCEELVAALRPSGLCLIVTEEECESYGPLKSRMRRLEPTVEPRLAARQFASGPMLHAFRKASESSAEEGKRPPQAQTLREDRRRKEPEVHRTFIEPARINADPAKAMQQAMQHATKGADAGYSGVDHRVLDTWEAIEKQARPPRKPVAVPAVDAAAEPPEWVSKSVSICRLSRGKGRGLVTTRPVEAGELLMVTRASFMGAAEVLAASVVSWFRAPGTSQLDKQKVYAAFDGSNGDLVPPLELYLPGQGQQALAEAPPVPAKMELERLHRILKLNAFQVDALQDAAQNDPGRQRRQLRSRGSPEGNDDEQVTGLWPLASLMNHSCLPSVTTVPVTKATLCIVAAYKLPAGAELSNRYFKLDLPAKIRQEELQERQEFLCACPRCAADLSELPEETVQRILLLQEKASALDVPTPDLVSALRGLATTVREVAGAASRCWCQKHQGLAKCGERVVRSVFKGSFLRVFAAYAMALETQAMERSEKIASRGKSDQDVLDTMQDLETREGAWREVCEIYEQLEPCCPSHLFAASQLCRIVQDRCSDAGIHKDANARKEAARYCFATWLGRHGIVRTYCSVVDGLSKAPEALERRLSTLPPKEQAALADAFAESGMLSAVASPIKADIDWAPALKVLQQFGVLARDWACAHTTLSSSQEADSPADSVAVSPAVAIEQADVAAGPPTHTWEKMTGDCWRLRVFGYSSAQEATPELSETALRFGPSASYTGGLEIDLLQEIGGKIDTTTVKARFVKSSVQSSGDTIAAHLRVDMQLKEAPSS